MPDQLAASFVAAASAFLYPGAGSSSVTVARLSLADSGERLPDYTVPASASISASRKSDISEWAMLFDSGLVVTPEDREITKGVSSRARFEEMSVTALIGEGFHLNTREYFPATPSAPGGIGCIPSGSAISLLWSLRFFAEHIYGKGAPDRSQCFCAAERQLLDAMVFDELVLFLVLGVNVERSANLRTQFMPVEVINQLLAYEGEDCIPTREG